jgi:starvation-inducible DNA-binding protein
MAENGKVIDGLNGVLADGTVFYQKLRHYHWNVGGRDFFTLHVKFEELYTAWSVTLDEIAERILMLGGVPLHTLAALLERASLEEDESIPTAPEMVDALLADLTLLRERMRAVIDQAESTDDRSTANLLDAVYDAMDKDAWMLSAWKKEAAKSWN